MLIVPDDQRIPSKHHAITPPEGFGNIVGDIYANLESDVWLVLKLHRSLRQMFNIDFCRGYHLVVPQGVLLQLFDCPGVLSRLYIFEFLLGGDFAEAVGQRPLLCVFTCVVREGCFEPGRWGAVQPTVSR